MANNDLADWADREIQRIMDETRSEDKKVSDMTEAEWDREVDRANRLESDTGDVYDRSAYEAATDTGISFDNIDDIVKDFIGDIVPDINIDLSGIQKWVEDLIRSILSPIAEGISFIVGGVSKAFDAVVGAIWGEIKDVWNAVDKSFIDLSGQFQKVFDLFTEFAGDRLEELLAIPSRAFFGFLEAVLPE